MRNAPLPAERPRGFRRRLPAEFEWGLGSATIAGISDAVGGATFLLDTPLTPRMAIQSALFTGAVSLLAYTVVRLLLGAALRRREIPSSPLSGAAAGFVVGTSSLAAFLANSGKPWDEILGGGATSFMVVAAGVLAGLAAAGLVWSAERVGTSEGILAASLRAAPLVITAAALAACALRGEGLRMHGRAPLVLGALGATVTAIALLVPLVRRTSCRPLPYLVPAALVLAVAAIGAAPAARVEADEKLVLLVTIDTMRADALSLADGGPTPNLAAFARDAAFFPNASSAAPWTLPAMASLHTGMPADLHRYKQWDSSGQELAPPTLARALAAAGYRTAAIVDHPRIRPENFPLDGFEEAHFSQPARSFFEQVGRRLFAAARRSRLSTYPAAEEVTDAGVDWLRSHRGGRSFLWVHYFQLHAPYHPPTRFFADPIRPVAEETGNTRWVGTHADFEQSRELYSADVRYVDEQVGRLLTFLRSENRLDRALVVIAADHGEEFLDHHGLGHGQSLYDELIHVPLVIRFPGGLPRGRFETPVSTASIPATVLETSGAAAPPGPPAAASILPLARGTPSGTDVAVTSTGVLYGPEQIAVRLGSRKYVVDLATGTESLFDLRDDPKEVDPLRHPPEPFLSKARSEVARLDAVCLDYRRRHGKADNVDPSIEAIRRLQTIGYIGGH